MKGDIRTLRKRLNDGEVNKGQKGMVEGDSVSAYIRDLDALHTQLYFCLSEEEHERCPELSDDNMKDVLLANICGTYLETALAFDASHQNKATYNQICLHLRQLENIHQNHGTFRHKGKAARTLSAVSSNAAA